MPSLKSILVHHDEQLTKALNIRLNHQGLYPWINRLTRTMDPLPSMVITTVLMAYLFVSSNWLTGYRFIGLYFTTEAIIHFLKATFSRRRPFRVLHQLVFEVPIPKDPHSFPSGHTGSAVVIALVLGWLFPAYTLVFSLYPLLIGFSRIYLGYHYPSDVLVGGVIPLVLAGLFS
ncbi:MAG: hypothetical protein AVO33_02225 [delta proteobacterium ML8_F1]|nr:MAG: hypothetical protein AVO33_02225 [delta proteobacterium ML8_F1]